jgi:SsrA-binding protein
VEIDRIIEKVREGGLTLVPLSMYFDNGWAKVELALARGRRSWDKRQSLAERDANRDIAREMSRHLKGITGRMDPAVSPGRPGRRGPRAVPGRGRRAW